MVTEHSGGGDLRRSIALLWGVAGPGRRGPKPSRTVDEVVLAAIGIADAEGLASLSMRRVAESLGLSPMSLYTYVPSKAELLDLMVDRVAREIEPPDKTVAGWRSGIEHLARRRWDMARRHPWMMQVSVHRPPLGPNVLASVEATLRTLDGQGLSELEMDGLATVILDYVRGSARAAIDALEIERQSGVTDEQWWAQNEQLLEGLVDPARYPTTVRVGESFKATQQTGVDPVAKFEFGLQRVLDGVEVFIDSRKRTGA